MRGKTAKEGSFPLRWSPWNRDIQVTVYEFEGRPYVVDPTRYAQVGDIPRITNVEPLENCRVWVEYENGEKGEADLARLLDKRPYCGWRNREYFETVRPVAQFLVWGDGELDIAPESLYMWVTGKSFEEVCPVRFLDVP